MTLPVIKPGSRLSRSRLGRDLLCLGFCLTYVIPVIAESWLVTVGADELELFLGAEPSAGNSIVVGQIEATSTGENNYLPASPGDSSDAFSGSGSFLGKTFYQDSGTGILSSHAAGVGNYFYGLTQSLVPGVTEIRCQSAAGFIFLFLGTPYADITSLEDPRQVDGAIEQIQSHAYIAAAADLDPDEMNDMAARMDFMVNDSSVLPVVGLGNGSTSSIPPMWNSAYNVLSVGRSDGGHSSGTTPIGFDGAGRVKPEIVAPLTTTSSNTGAVASAATLMLSTAVEIGLGANAQEPETIKAVLLAGASKVPFPDWTNATAPLDSHYGAGQLDVLGAYRILVGGAQTGGTVSSPAAVPVRGWSFDSANNSAPTVYTITVPDKGLGAECSIILTWNRSVTEVRSGTRLNYLYDYEPNLLPDLALTLTGPDEWSRTSDSSIDNVEHIYVERLPPGDYTLEVTSATSSATDFALAWRVETVLFPRLGTVEDPSSTTLYLDRLEPSWSFWIERSAEMESWNMIHSFNVLDDFYEWTDPAPLEPVGFYRLKWFSP